MSERTSGGKERKNTCLRNFQVETGVSAHASTMRAIPRRSPETRSLASASELISSTLFSEPDNMPYRQDNSFVYPGKLEPGLVLDGVIGR
jgi:hypothetical protein